MSKFVYALSLLTLFCVISCSYEQKKVRKPEPQKHKEPITSVIVDCNYSFEQAIEGSKAPDSVLTELKLINVRYYSIDGKVHAGQILTNKKIAGIISQMFEYMLLKKFPVAHAIPIVKYHWNDDLSMSDNNSYSFCYRNVSYSKHARGMAIDINPYFNPVIWKKGYEYRLNKPVGAHYDLTAPGTFTPSGELVAKFEELGMRWGHNFTRNYDNHHFER
jgi:hypothetical protein